MTATPAPMTDAVHGENVAMAGRTLEFQLGRLWDDHRSSQGRFVTIAALFPGVIAAAFTPTFFPADSGSGALSQSAGIVISFAPLLIFLWWSGVLVYLAIGSAKRYRILHRLEMELARVRQDPAVFAVNDIMGRDPVGRARSTTASIAFLILVPGAAYSGLLLFAVVTATARGVESILIGTVTTSVIALSGTLYGSALLRLRFYSSQLFNDAIVPTQDHLL